MTHAIFSLAPKDYVQHALHDHNQNFRETNCYTDLIIEIVNGLGLNPLACLGYTLAADFEDDQWTFGKPSHFDLQNLYGMRVEELSLYKDLETQMLTQIGRGVIPLVEVDAFHLPDTVGIDYRTGHAKTTVGISYLDPERKVMHYFHNATFTSLSGEDYDGILKPAVAEHSGYLPPYCEMIKLEQVKSLSEDALKLLAFASAKHHFSKRHDNPIDAHAQSMAMHQQQIVDGGLPAYHAYTFVALRQLGASHQLGAHFLRWLDNAALNETATHFDAIAQISKSLVLKLARVANSGKVADFSNAFTDMSHHWHQSHNQLQTYFNQT